MNIWIVQASSGQYDDYNTWNVKAFTSKEKADKWIEDQKARAEVDEDFNGYFVSEQSVELVVVD